MSQLVAYDDFNRPDEDLNGSPAGDGEHTWSVEVGVGAISGDQVEFSLGEAQAAGAFVGQCSSSSGSSSSGRCSCAVPPDRQRTSMELARNGALGWRNEPACENWRMLPVRRTPDAFRRR